MTNQQTNETLAAIAEVVLPAQEQLRLTGTLKNFPFNPVRLQELYKTVFGYNYDHGCSDCIAEALRMLANVYREQSTTPGGEKLIADVLELNPEAVKAANKIAGQIKRAATIAANKAAKEAEKGGSKA